eukprot:5799062-Karenia_brevis.AAC.1
MDAEKEASMADLDHVDLIYIMYGRIAPDNCGRYVDTKCEDYTHCWMYLSWAPPHLQTNAEMP